MILDKCLNEINWKLISDIGNIVSPNSNFWRGLTPVYRTLESYEQKANGHFRPNGEKRGIVV